MKLTIIGPIDNGVAVECTCGTGGVFKYEDASGKHKWYYCSGCSSEYNIDSFVEDRYKKDELKAK